MKSSKPSTRSSTALIWLRMLGLSSTTRTKTPILSGESALRSPPTPVEELGRVRSPDSVLSSFSVVDVGAMPQANGARRRGSRNLARAPDFGNAMGMEHRCEVCESFRLEGDPGAARELLEVPFGERRVLLCRGHAAIAKNSGVSTLEELRALYAESHGQRSYVARRARIAQSKAGQARSVGRRSSDLAS